jgi:hypothetical protein
LCRLALLDRSVRRKHFFEFFMDHIINRQNKGFAADMFQKIWIVIGWMEDIKSFCMQIAYRINLVYRLDNAPFAAKVSHGKKNMMGYEWTALDVMVIG